MSINTFSSKLIKNRQLQLEIESGIDELVEIETKICAKLMKTPDCVQEAPQPFIDTNPDYVNPLKLIDNSSRIRVFEHIEKAELLAENESDYVMQPFPMYDSISWILKSQIPIKSMNLDSYLLEPLKSSGSTFLSPLLPRVTSTDEEWLNLESSAQEEIDKELTTFKQFSSIANSISYSLANSDIEAGLRNTKLQVIAEECCGDNKSGDVFPVNTPITIRNDVIFGMENPEVNNIYSNKSEREDELCPFGFRVINGEENENLESIPENQSKDVYLMDVFSRNNESKKGTNGYFWPENYNFNNLVDKKANLKFQYAAVIGDNLEKEISNSEDCIVLVCKECGFQEYI